MALDFSKIFEKQKAYLFRLKRWCLSLFFIKMLKLIIIFFDLKLGKVFESLTLLR